MTPQQIATATGAKPDIAENWIDAINAACQRFEINALTLEDKTIFGAHSGTNKSG